MKLEWPQVVMLALYFIQIGFSLSKHGEPKTGKHNFFVSVIATAIGAWILYKGGFWG